MKKLIVLLGSLSLLSLSLTSCGDDSSVADNPDAGGSVVTPDAGSDTADSGTDNNDKTDAGNSGHSSDSGTHPGCSPKTTDELADTYCAGNLNDFCGTKNVDDGCGNQVSITCDCRDSLICNLNDHKCGKAEECVPLTKNTGNAYYCTEQECGGPVLRDDLCGGTVWVNCGGDKTKEGNPICESDTGCQTGCKDPNSSCKLDPNDPSWLRCVKTNCTPNAESVEDFCNRYHSKCGITVGQDSCNAVKKENCGSCDEQEELCRAWIPSKADYVERSCQSKPSAAEIKACEQIDGDTSDKQNPTKVMLVEQNGSYLYAAPELVYAYTPTKTGQVTVKVTPWNNSDYDVVLYVVDDLASRTPIALANEQTYGANEQVNFNATANKTYYIVVDGGDWASTKYDRGAFRLTVDDGTCKTTDKLVVISAIYTGANTGWDSGSKKPVQKCAPDTIGGGTSIGTSECFTYRQNFIELHNQSDKDVDINGYSLMKTAIDNTSGKNWQEIVKIQKETILPAGGYYLLSAKSPDDDDCQTYDLKQADVDKQNGATKWTLSSEQKIFLSRDSTMDATAMNKAGNPCPTTDENGQLFVFGGKSVCGTNNAAIQSNQFYSSSDGCADMTVTDFTVTTKKETKNNNTTYKITNISPKPRNSNSDPNVCQ